MNERFKKLADSVGLGVRHDGIVLTKNVNAAEAFEQFAELIVRECTNLLPEDSIRDPNGVHMFYVIRKHFGVSEIG